MLIDSEELEEEEDEIGENSSAFPKKLTSSMIFPTVTMLKASPSSFSTPLDNIDAPRVLALFERQHAEEVISLSVFIYLFIYVCMCVRARVRVCGCSLVSLVYSRVFFGPKSHIKCRVRLSVFSLGGGGGGGGGGGRELKLFRRREKMIKM